MPAALVFQMLADPTRRRIVESLREGERSVGSLVGAVSMSQPGVSRHLRILHRAGLVRVRASGQHRFYSLERRPFEDLDLWMEDFRDLVDARLDRLRGLVEEPAGPSRSPKRKSSGE